MDTALIPVTPSTYYTVSARAKISSGTYLLGIQWYDSGMGYLTEEYGTFTNTSYSQVYFTKQLPSNAYYVKIFFTIIPGTGARTLCGDEFQLEQNSTYTTWEDPATVGGNFSESVAVNQLTTKSVTDSDAAVETLTTKNEFLIQCTAWILESILRDITTAIIDGSMITEAIPIDKVSLIPDTLAGTDLAGASSERTLPDNGAGQELINVSVTILLQESFTDAETIILQEFIPLLESVHGIDSHTVKTFLSLLETGTSEEIYNFITRFTQTETPIGADLINTRPEVIETDIGSGIETTQLQNTIPLPDTGTGNDLATLFIQLITMDNVSATTSPILNFFTIISDLMVWTDVVSLGGTGNTITTTDTITITTNALVEVTTPILEGLNATEIASILNVALSQTDQAQGMGLTSILIQLSHTDSIVVTDTLKLDITKNIPDGSTLVEIIAALDNSVKRIQDGVSIIEEFRCGITLLSDDNVTASIISLIKKLLFAGWVTVTFTMEIPWTGLAMPTPATEFETKKPRTVLIME